MFFQYSTVHSLASEPPDTSCHKVSTKGSRPFKNSCSIVGYLWIVVEHKMDCKA